MLKPHDLVTFRVIEQGSIIVNSIDVEQIGNDVVALNGDLRAKYAEVSGACQDESDIPGLYLSMGPDTLKPAAPFDVSTLIALPEFRGWRVHCATISRYTLRACLVRHTS